MKFRSQLEEKVADLLSNLGVSYEYESTKVPYILQCNYTPDFLLKNGVFLETKGHLTEEDRRKMKAVKKANPDLDIRFVFQAPFNKINKKSKTTYAAWAEKNGFQWAAYHSIPVEWLT
jgi:3-deoxy-D-manno-octulosonic acid (KDO) 8-phosphate synthase